MSVCKPSTEAEGGEKKKNQEYEWKNRRSGEKMKDQNKSGRRQANRDRRDAYMDLIKDE